jgi:hypothetical protein
VRGNQQLLSNNKMNNDIEPGTQVEIVHKWRGASWFEPGWAAHNIITQEGSAASVVLLHEQGMVRVFARAASVACMDIAWIPYLDEHRECTAASMHLHPHWLVSIACSLACRMPAIIILRRCPWHSCGQCLL